MQTAIDASTPVSPCETSDRERRRSASRQPELLLWILLLTAGNLPLLTGSAAESMVFYPEAASRGEWWRIFTFPFVHLSGYHLLLDAASFLLLYNGLEEERRWRRLLCVILPGAFSLLLSLLSPTVYASGLCGLSGVAHGLMAVAALELMGRNARGTSLFRAGAAVLAMVVAKTLLEVSTGQVLFAGLHFGAIGLPVVESHAGGLLGGLLAFALLNRPHTSGMKSPANDEVPKAGKVIDMHCHIAGIGAGGSGCFVSGKLRKSWKYRIYLRAFGTSEREIGEHGDALVIERLSRDLARSKSVDAAVVLAMDGVVGEDGELDRHSTEIYIPNEFVAKEVRRYGNLHFGASVNPYRTDALERLKGAAAEGAVLVKWLPSIQHIDPADEKLIPFYLKLKELGLPLLTHAGDENSFTGARNELGDPARLHLPLRLGVTVIAAHAATTGKNEGIDNMERLLPMFAQYPNLYTDISSLTQINKMGTLPRLLASGVPRDRLLYGTDMPLPRTGIASPLFHALRLPAGRMVALARTENSWDRDVALKRDLGVPEAVFTNAAALLNIEEVGAGRIIDGINQG